MSLKKLSTDVRTHIQTIVASEMLDRLNHLSGEKLSYFRAILDSPEFWSKADVEPQLIEGYMGFSDGSCDFVREQYIFQNCAYRIKGEFTPEQEKLLVQDDFDSERIKFERLQNKFNLCKGTEARMERAGIPEEVRIAVWRRDSGCCVKCGSREKLEYDHIIPISRGGSNTVRNIELLCEKCNRSKSDNIQ